MKEHRSHNKPVLTGALLQVVFHALAKVCLFLCAGALIHYTHHTRVSEFRGVGRQMPLVMWCFALAGLSLMGIPPLGGFVSKWYLAEGGLTQLGVLGGGYLHVAAVPRVARAGIRFAVLVLEGAYLLPALGVDHLAAGAGHLAAADGE